MDRIISKSGRQNLLKDYEFIHLFPYSVAAVMFAGIVYILHQFIVITSLLNH